MSAIEAVETNGKCDSRGKSGEGGCLQYMPNTWVQHSKEILGEVREMLPEIERYVAVKKVEAWSEEGYTKEEIPLLWNQGNTSPCKSGTNKYGVKYDSCAYTEKVLALLR